MRFRDFNRWPSILMATALLFGSGLSARAEAALLQEGAIVDLGGRKGTLKKLDTLPYAESDYTRRFTFDKYENPKLKELRDRYKLEELIAPGKDEFDKQVILMDWAHRQFKKFGQP